MMVFEWIDGNIPALVDGEYYAIIEALRDVEASGKPYLKAGEIGLDKLSYRDGRFEGTTGGEPRWKVLFWAPATYPQIPYDIALKIRNLEGERVRYGGVCWNMEADDG